MKTNETNKRTIKVCLLGASFDTGNLGVSALAESSIKIILNRWPGAEIILIGSGYEPQQIHLRLMGREFVIRTIPIRFCKNVFLPYHFLWFTTYGLLLRLLPKSRAKDMLLSRNPYVRTLYETDLTVDITGGDSFSDLYGMRRFLLDFLCKWLVIAFRKKLVLLPQTYGPYKRWLTRALAKYILNHATTVYSRDRSSVEFVKDMLETQDSEDKIKFLPDVAFVLDAHRPNGAEIRSIEEIRAENTVVVGLNISGLLFHGGYTQDNMFGLRTDYQQLIHEIIDLLLKYDKVVVLLIPHVFPPRGLEVESDPIACSRVYKLISRKYVNRIVQVDSVYNHNEIKHIIGLCDFFIGSRMHACIAALSQGIPTIGLAYSKKFAGVFETVDAEQFVVDLRYTEAEEALTMIVKNFEQRNIIAGRLKATIPKIQQQILTVLDGIS